MKTKNMNTDELKKYWKEFGYWHIKMDFLGKEIENLKKQNNTISLISAFLLETQYIEFHLQGLLTELDLVKYEPNIASHYLGRKYKRSGKGIEYYELTLGQIKDELKQYKKVDFLYTLNSLLDKLNKLRKEFAHHLFSYATGVEDLIAKSKEGQKLNKAVLLETNNTFKYIEENTTIGRMFTSKKTKFNSV